MPAPPAAPLELLRATPWARLGDLGSLGRGPRGLVGQLDDGGPSGIALMACFGGLCAARTTGDAPALALIDAARRALPPQSLRSLWGLDPFGRRLWFYHYVREGLPDWVQSWWDARERGLRLGLAGQGREEQRVARLEPLWRGPPALRRAALRLAGARGVAEIGAPDLGAARRGGGLLDEGFGLSDAELAAARGAPPVQWVERPPPLDGLWLGEAPAPAAWMAAVEPGGWIAGFGQPRIPSGWAPIPLALRAPLRGPAWAARRAAA